MFRQRSSAYDASATGSRANSAWLLLEFAIFIALGVGTSLWIANIVMPVNAWWLLAGVVLIPTFVLVRPDRLVVLRFWMLDGIVLAVYAVGMTIGYLYVAVAHPMLTEVYFGQFWALVASAIAFAVGACAARLRCWLGGIAGIAFAGAVILSFSTEFENGMLVARMGVDDMTWGFQVLGDSLSVLALIIALRIRRPLIVYLIAAICMTLLLQLPSRSAILLGGIAMMTLSVVFSPPRGRLLLAAFGVVAVIIVRLLSTSPSADLELGAKPPASAPRAAEASSVLTPAEAAIQFERRDAFNAGWDAILEHPVLGSFAFQLQTFNRPRMHMRNMLDGWAQAGLIPFVFFLLLWTVLIRQWYLLFRRSATAALWLLPMLVLPASAWLLFRPLNYAVLHVCLGYFCSAVLWGFSDTDPTVAT